MTFTTPSPDETQILTRGTVRSIESLFRRAVDGDRRSLARLFTRIERDGSDLREVMRLSYSAAGHGPVIGITGPPGAGKSTIVDGLAAAARAEGKSVGILAVDPTSPFTGGAVLGDRIRMQSHHGDAGVYIRSLATKGVPGGLNAVTSAGAKLLEAVGKDVVLIETVGVGQSEYDVKGIADVVVVVLVPEAGDTVQTLKAGLLEIADIFVVNKSDRDGAGQMASALRATIALGDQPSKRLPPVLLTQAHIGQGTTELYAELSVRIDSMIRSGELDERRSRQASQEVGRLLRNSAIRAVERVLDTDSEVSELLERVRDCELDPYTAVQSILASGIIADVISELALQAGEHSKT